MVDTHVHLMDPGDISRETFPAGSAAAVANGITTIVEHTHSHPVRTVADFRDKLEHLQGRARTDYGLAAHVWSDNLIDLSDLWAAGVAFFKIFTCATHGVPAVEGDDLRTALAEIARIGGATLIHCEDDSLTAEAERQLRAAGRTDPGLLIEWRSRSAEKTAVEAVLTLARQTDVRATIAHVSTPELANMVAATRALGANVVAEACPQYLLLREDEVHAQGAFSKFTPPARLRSDSEEAVMWRALVEGGFGHVSSDHAPSTIEQKSAGTIWEAPFGLPGLDTTLALMMEAVAAGRITWTQLVGLYSQAPARRYRLYPRKGHLEVGADADFILVDPHRTWRIGERPYLSRAGWSPYDGRRVRGWVHATFLRGVQVASDGVPQGELRGAFVRPCTRRRL
jgi:dihydroorotase